jgi:hypothetical protein
VRAVRLRKLIMGIVDSPLDETFDIGEDTGTPVVEDYVNKMPFTFTGVLKQVVIEPGKSGLTANDAKKVEKANKKLAEVRD